MAESPRDVFEALLGAASADWTYSREFEPRVLAYWRLRYDHAAGRPAASRAEQALAEHDAVLENLAERVSQLEDSRRADDVAAGLQALAEHVAALDSDVRWLASALPDAGALSDDTLAQLAEIARGGHAPAMRPA